nr:NAD(P)-binding domain-containing protein [Methanobacterium formicicum]
MKKQHQLRVKKIIIIGAGGAARAIAFQLLLSGVGEVLIANRTREKACNLRNDLKKNIQQFIRLFRIG